MIDCFFAAEHEQRKLAPAPKAARHILPRRVYLNRIGSPPPRTHTHTHTRSRSRCGRSSRIVRRRQTSKLLIAYRRALNMGNVGGGIGGISGAIVIGLDGTTMALCVRFATASGISGGGLTGLWSPSTRIAPTVSWYGVCWPRTNLLGDRTMNCGPPDSWSSTSNDSAVKSGCKRPLNILPRLSSG